jgi:tripartite-type tricarboxylate transporter receptor subunit TctC
MRSLLSTIALGLLLPMHAVHADEYPNRAVQIIVPFSPGGVTDTAARLVGQKLSATWGQPVTVSNRPGSGAIVGVDAVAKSTPDGYTLLMATNGEIALHPAIYSRLPYDLEKDLVPVSMLINTPLLWVTGTKNSINSIEELVAAAKAHPDQISYSSPGPGSMNQLTAEWFAQEAGIRLLHVPYKGGAPATTALLRGEVSVSVIAISSALSYIKSGELKVLAVTTKQHTAIAPQWPTVAESGLPGFDAPLWVGLFAPSGVPAAIVQTLQKQVSAALQAPDVREQLAALGAEPVGMTSAEFAVRIKQDGARFMAIARTAQIQPE